MICQYRQKEGSHTLLCFFTGWGTTAEVVAHLPLPDGWDYLVANDYRTISPTDLPALRKYGRTYLVAWSMGVWAAEVLSDFLPPLKRAIAINGTPMPMHDLYGIPEQIFQATLSGLNDDNRARFNRRMCGGKELLSVYNSFAARSTEELREELFGVYQKVKELRALQPPRLHWSKALVSAKDLIVPAPNQIRYWECNSVPYCLLPNLGHYPLRQFSSWDELLSFDDEDR